MVFRMVDFPLPFGPSSPAKPPSGTVKPTPVTIRCPPMSTDKKPEDQITEAGAVELDETQLEEAAGGIIAVVPVVAPPPSPEWKLNPENKFNPGPIVAPDFKFRG